VRKTLVWCGAILALSAATSFAGDLDLTWNDCVLESTTENLNYANCGSEIRTIRLYGSFKVPVQLPAFVAADVSMDLQEDGVGPLDKFWRMDSAGDGGCNSSGIQIRIDADVNGTCAGETNPWGPGGANASAYFINFVNGQGGPNRGRLLFSIARPTADPQRLDPKVNYYMANFDINSSQRAACPGCTSKVTLIWNSAIMYDLTGNTVTLVGANKLGNCAEINAPVSKSPCSKDATQKQSWSRLKSLYR
jgi:hypothetical protein